MAKSSVYQDRVFDGIVSEKYDFFRFEQVTHYISVPLVWMLENERG